MTTHNYELALEWEGNTGTGTSTARGYSRDHSITADGPGTIAGSSDPSFRGDTSRWNPEQLFVAALAQCHMLWYLGLAAQSGVVVTNYTDTPTGTMIEEVDGSGRFDHVLLRPRVTITEGSDVAVAEALHERVGDFCFIARSVSIPVRHEPVTIREEGTDVASGT